MISPRAEWCEWGWRFDKTHWIRDEKYLASGSWWLSLLKIFSFYLYKQTTAYHTVTLTQNLYHSSLYHLITHYAQSTTFTVNQIKCITFRIRILSLLWWVHWLILTSGAATFLEFRKHHKRLLFFTSPFRPFGAFFIWNVICMVAFDMAF